MEYLTVREAGEKWGITARMVNYYCSSKQINGAEKKGNLWLVPADAERPVDGRIKKTINMNCRALVIEENMEIKAGNMKYSVLLNFRKLVRQLAEPSMEALHDEQIDKWARLFTKKIYKADEYFSTPEAPSTSLAYVAKGLFRRYVVDRYGVEVTLNFTEEIMFMSSYSAFTMGQIYPAFIQALEDSEVYAIPRTEYLKHWKTDARLKDMLQKATEFDCMRTGKRELGFLLYDAGARYFSFLEDFPRCANRIKLRYIASHLGISPETLSRIRQKTE